MQVRHTRWAVFIVVALSAIAWTAWPFVTAGAMLLDFAGRTSWVRDLIPVGRLAVTSEDFSIPTRHGAVVARLYQPKAGSPRTAIVFPGVHGGGVDEPRLVLFSERLASTGINVVSVPLPDLRAFRITGRSTDVIEDVTVSVASTPRLAPRGRVAIFGVSFAGGLALVAAGRPAVADRLSMVLSIGGHGDLGRVLRYLCSGVLPDGTRRPPHDYGLAIVALADVPRLVPAEQVPALEAAILTYLEASVDESPGQDSARALLADARRRSEGMLEPSRSVMTWITTHDLVAIGRRVAPDVDALAADARLSPERMPSTRVPVFLIQGDEDNVIPSSETPQLAEYLQRAGNSHVHWLLTPVLSHLGLDPGTGLGNDWRLVRFWRAVTSAMD